MVLQAGCAAGGMETVLRNAQGGLYTSAGRQALEGACLVPGDTKTLEALKDLDRRPALPRNSVPDDIAQFAPAEEFSLAQDLFLANVRSAHRGAAPGPSGMTADHVRPLLEAHRDAAALSHAASLSARNKMPEEVMVAIRCGGSLLSRSLTGESGVLL